MTMATAPSRRLAAGLQRQWHRSHARFSSQLLARSPRAEPPPPSPQPRRAGPSCRSSFWQREEQRRYLSSSNHLKQRAIDALKSKRNSNTSSGGASAADSENASADDGDRGFGKKLSRNTNIGGDGDARKEGPTSAVATAAASSADSSPVEVPAPTTAETPPAAIAPNPAPDVVAASGADANADAGGAAAAATPGPPDDAAAGSGPAGADSNPWAHMHLHEFAPKIVVVGVGGAGTNAVNNMVASGLAGVEFLALNTDAQHLSTSLSPTRLQIGTHLTSGLGCGANPDAGRLAAEESSEAIQSCIEDAHMVFITAGMGGGTGTGAAPVVAGLCYDLGILTVSVVTTPFRFEGTHRRRLALEGVDRLKQVSDTLIVVPNQNLFRLVGEKTSFVDSFRLADDVLLAGVRSITDLMTSPGLINLDFADVQSVMHGMGNALLGTGQACHNDVIGSYGIGGKKGEGKKEAQNAGEGEERSADAADGGGEEECRAIRAAKMALNNPLLGEGNMDVGSAKGMLVNMTGGSDMTLYEVDRAAEFITERVQDPDANIIFGSAYDANLTGCIRVSVVATGIDEGE